MANQESESSIEQNLRDNGKVKVGKDLNLEEIFLVKISEKAGTGYDYTLCFPSENSVLQFLEKEGFELRETYNNREQKSHFADVQLRGVGYFSVYSFLHPTSRAGAHVEKLVFRGKYK